MRNCLTVTSRTGAWLTWLLFFGVTVFNRDLSKWDVSSVNGMYGMFNDAAVFNVDLSKWDASNVQDMGIIN